MNKIKLTDSRDCFKPFTYPWAYDRWLEHERAHWLPTEIALHEDIKDWNTKLTESERNLLTHIFMFFTQSDIDVAGGYVKSYLPYFPQPEIRMMLCSFASREATHIAAYSYLIESIGMPETTYDKFLEYKAMKDKHDYFNDLVSLGKLTPKQIALNIAAFSAFTEGLQLFSSFVVMLNFPRHGKMRGMGQIITWSILDESIHTESMIELFRTYIKENRELWNDDLKERLYNIARKMVELEDKFIDLAFEQGSIEGLTIEDMKQYIRYVADRRLIGLGLKGHFKVKTNPLKWVDQMINAPIHTNFFEQRSVSYSMGALSGSWGDVWAK